MTDYSNPPSTSTLPINPFKATTPQQKLTDFQTLIRLSPIAAPTYENSDPSVAGDVRRYGVPRDWLLKAKEHWVEKFDWRKVEDKINSYPNYTAQVKDDSGNALTVHFVALFSKREDAVPIALYHGWPGSFLEFLQILDILKEKYTPETLPYHIIVPSIPGYAYSSGPPLNLDYGLENATMALDALMTGLFPQGYLAQGGDLGSFVSRIQAVECNGCKGAHFNFAPISRPENAGDLEMSEVEAKALKRGLWFRDVASAYAHEHGTRTATIGHVLSASPMAMLAWIGEKFLEWTDEDPPLDAILESVTLYWMTETFPRCIYPYRGLSGGEERPRIATNSGKGRPRPYVEKPSGYSFFPKELVPMPVSWVKTNINLVSSKVHQSGGHFAAMEKPKELLEDIEEYVKVAWKA